MSYATPGGCSEPPLEGRPRPLGQQQEGPGCGQRCRWHVSAGHPPRPPPWWRTPGVRGWHADVERGACSLQLSLRPTRVERWPAWGLSTACWHAASRQLLAGALPHSRGWAATTKAGAPTAPVSTRPAGGSPTLGPHLTSGSGPSLTSTSASAHARPPCRAQNSPPAPHPHRHEPRVPTCSLCCTPARRRVLGRRAVHLRHRSGEQGGAGPGLPGHAVGSGPPTPRPGPWAVQGRGCSRAGPGSEARLPARLPSSGR